VLQRNLLAKGHVLLWLGRFAQAGREEHGASPCPGPPFLPSVGLDWRIHSPTNFRCKIKCQVCCVSLLDLGPGTWDLGPVWYLPRTPHRLSKAPFSHSSSLDFLTVLFEAAWRANAAVGKRSAHLWGNAKDINLGLGKWFQWAVACDFSGARISSQALGLV
jgi:hypothetical protein